MDKQEIAAFLDAQKDLPPALRRKIYAHHAGVRPMWLVSSMRRQDDAIVVIGTWNRDRPSKRLHVALRWYWTAEEIGVWWQSFKNESKVSELKIRIDSPHVVFERSGLRPD